MKTNKAKYLVNFRLLEQGFSEIVLAEDKKDAIEVAKNYLEKRFAELKYNVDVLQIYEEKEKQL
jgi:predicted CoA-binding protein